MTVEADAAQIVHEANRASYDCRACGRPWPCDPAREELTETHDPVQLAIVMWDALEDAARVLSGEPAPVLFNRFISWTGPAA
jgi:citrate lyase alpha subunit